MAFDGTLVVAGVVLIGALVDVGVVVVLPAALGGDLGAEVGVAEPADVDLDKAFVCP